VLTPDGLTIFFTGLLPIDDAGDVVEDIWTAKRPSLSEPFSSLRNVAELNDESGPDWPNWVSPDACRFYFTRADNALYVAEHPK